MIKQKETYRRRRRNSKASRRRRRRWCREGGGGGRNGVVSGIAVGCRDGTEAERVEARGITEERVARAQFGSRVRVL